MASGEREASHLGFIICNEFKSVLWRAYICNSGLTASCRLAEMGGKTRKNRITLLKNKVKK